MVFIQKLQFNISNRNVISQVLLENNSSNFAQIECHSFLQTLNVVNNGLLALTLPGLVISESAFSEYIKHLTIKV